MRGALGIELCHKDVICPRIGTLIGILRGKVCRGSKPCNVSVTFGVHSDAVATIIVSAAQVGGVMRGALGIELCHKDVIIPRMESLNGILRGKVCGISIPCNVSVTFGVHSEAAAPLIVSAAQVGGVEEYRTVGTELRQKDVSAARIGILIGILRGKVCGISQPLHVEVTCDVHSDVGARLISSAAQVGGVDKRGAPGIELCHKDVKCTPPMASLNGIIRGKVCGLSQPLHVDVTCGIHSDAVAILIVLAAQVGGVAKDGVYDERKRFVIITRSKSICILIYIY